MHKSGFAGIGTLAIVTAVILASVGATLYFKSLTPGLSSTASTYVPADWKTYRDENYGVEFKYPPTINGKPTGVSVDQYGGISIFRSEIKYGPARIDERTDESYQPDIGESIYFSVSSFADAEYPEIGGKSENDVLIYDVDLGGQGGYVYEPSKDVWHERDFPSEYNAKDLSWDDFFSLLAKYSSDVLPDIVTVSGLQAFVDEWGAYESSGIGYDIFVPERKLLISFDHGDGYANMDDIPQSAKDAAKADHDAILKILPEIVKTLSVK